MRNERGDNHEQGGWRLLQRSGTRTGERLGLNCPSNTNSAGLSGSTS